MVKYFFLAILFTILSVFNAHAVNYEYIDATMKDCPQSSAKTVEGIVKYINSKFNSDEEKLRAAYSWVSQHVAYDVSKMYTGIKYKTESEVVQNVLVTRNTICFGYAVTLKTIGEKLGFNIVNVTGYTKQNNKIDDVQHVWNAVELNGKWLLMDPSWSAGYISAGKFVKKYNDKWYLVQPQEFNKSHMPFDPVWQFSYFPLSNKEFYAGKTADSVTSRFFNYPDTIKAIDGLTEQQRLSDENRRIKLNGVVNQMITKHIERNSNYIDHLLYNDNVNKYNLAARLYNQATNLYNQYMKNKKNARNIQDARLALKSASDMLNEIQNPNRDMASSVRKLKASIKEMEGYIKKI